LATEYYAISGYSAGLARTLAIIAIGDAIIIAILVGATHAAGICLRLVADTFSVVYRLRHTGCRAGRREYH